MRNFLRLNSGSITGYGRKREAAYKAGGSRLSRLLSIGVVLLASCTAALAQTVTIGSTAVPVVSPATSSYFYGPIYRSTATSTFNYSKYAHLYTAAELGIPTGSIITNLEWLKADANTLTGNNTFTVLLDNTTSSTLTSGTTWGSLATGATQVYSSTTQNFTGAAGAYFGVPTNGTSNFVYMGNNLLILLDHEKNGTASGVLNFVTNPATDLAIGNASGSALTSTSTLTTGSYGNRRPTLRITYIPGSPCTAPPTTGTISASSTIICTGGSVTLNLTGNSFGSGQTYQLEASANGTSGWAAVGTSSSTPMFTTTQTATRFYRIAVTCSGQTATSGSVQVTTPSLIPASTFTINKGAPASGTNFQSFTAAVNFIKCGISGPIVFNVVANSGPYNEQVIMPVISGTSATNTITFNGNGNTISGNPSGTNLGDITLDGTDYTRFNNLVLNLDAAATEGWGVQLMNGADNNMVSNTTINLPLTSTSSVFNGIGFGATISTTDNNGSNNVFSNNTINGGYYAVRVNGNTGGTGATGNQFLNNTIRDNYIYNFYLSNTDGTLIQGNDVSRPTRTSVSTFYGVFMTSANQNVMVNKNRFYDAFGASSPTTSAAYVLYSSSTDAPVGSENVFKNNLIYNINTNGTIYAIYNIGSDGSHYFHNTIDLSIPTSTGTVRGVYQTTAATNVRIINNIFSIMASASGTKTGLYFNTATSAITSNNNVLYVPVGDVGYLGSAQTTLAAWQTASSQDANSVSADPNYVNLTTGNLRPTNNAINNIGQPLASVTDDITGATRNTTTPDPGAYEFTPATNDAGVVAITSPVSATCGASSQETVTITVQNFGLSPLSNLPVTYQINGGTFVANETIAGPIAPGATVTFSFNTKANLGAGGTFTILAKTMLTGDALAANDAASATISIINPISTFPHLENFETFTSATNATGFMNGWEATPSATTSAYRWNVDEGTTPSTATGPTVDHTTGTATGKYVFTEASSGSAGDTTVLTSPCVTLAAGSAIGMEFWYHMYGADIASLRVDVFNGTVWVRNVFVLTGQQQTATTDAWRKATVSLAAFSGNTIKIRFRAVRGPSFDGDIAIDDVRFFTLPPVELQLASVNLPTNGCGLSAAETVCVSIKNNGSTAISNFPVSYTVGTGTPVTETVAGPIAPGATLQYCFTAKANFSVPGNFTVSATVNATGDADAANNTTTGTTVSKPLISTFPYNENFENGAGNWVAMGTNSSWALGTPAGTVISTAGGGTNSWVTNLTGNYPNNENSTVTSPCFNFTNIANPSISMKIFWDAENDWDGAVLQSSIDGGLTWQNVGAYQDPNNWFDNNSIDALPGGQIIGWSGTGTTTGSGGWVTASHALTGLGGQASVQLRIAFASDGSTVNEGFAFDDVSISNMITAPTITAGGPTTFCQGGSVVLTAATTTPGATYTWERNGTAIAGATSATYTATTSGSYTAVANAGGTATSTPIVVTVNTAAATPTVTAGGPTTFCTGGSVGLTAASTTTGATYQWFLNGTAIPTATSATFTANAAGNYTVVATAGGCPSTASTATAVTVNATPAAPTITRNGAILTSSAATGNQWFINGVAIPGATGATLPLVTNGTYTVVTTANGCPSAASAALNIINLSAADALAGMKVQVYPNPASGSFNVKLEGYQKDASIILYSLTGQQILTEKATADGNARNISVKGLAAGLYMLKVTSDHGVQAIKLIVK